ncbi:hypothetical protein ACFW93_37255 [Streptomyces canus]|uniref:hypothetical protein n=1 Tax=Streptomyces canus TaxID=58343 RepID=UPI0036C0E84D
MAEFASFMICSRERARTAGTRPRSHVTVEPALAIMRDLARFLASERGKQAWALTDVHDAEAFLAHLPMARKRRLIAPGKIRLPPVGHADTMRA